jgi:hypothetical protein
MPSGRAVDVGAAVEGMDGLPDEPGIAVAPAPIPHVATSDARRKGAAAALAVR